jgi:hypothetical protein
MNEILADYVTLEHVAKDFLALLVYKRCPVSLNGTGCLISVEQVMAKLYFHFRLHNLVLHEIYDYLIGLL